MKRTGGGRPRAPRGRTGWVRAGRLELGQLGLPLDRARELVLESAWADVAGTTLSRRARPRRIHRGVLEVELRDERWSAALIELVPRIAGRLVGRYPELGVKRLRILRGEGLDAGPATAVEAVREDEGKRLRASTVNPPEREPPRNGEDRLRDLADRYLRGARAAQKP